MTRTASAALMPLDEALSILLRDVAPVAPVSVPLAAALGRISAADSLAPCDLPGRRIAQRDGWAVDSAHVTGASPYGPVPLARHPDWVEAGAALPEGTDTVLPTEAIEGSEAVADAAALDGTIAAGNDARAGGPLLRAGSRITPVHLAALAALGVEIIALRIPRLRLIATGSCEPALSDASTPMLCAMIEAAGATAAETLAAPDEVDVIAEAIGRGAVDAVLVLGGSGFGRTDRSIEALAQAGRILAHGIALRPGETAALGRVAGRPVLVLPGRPEAALAAFLVLARPLIAALCGAKSPMSEQSPLLRKISSTIGLSEIVFARRRPEGVEPLGGADIPLSRLVEADGAILVPPECEGYPERAEVAIMPL